jgi:hypothetical protein
VEVAKASGMSTLLSGTRAPMGFDGSEVILQLRKGKGRVKHGSIEEGKVSRVKLTGRG